MIARQLKEHEFLAFQTALKQRARSSPFCPIFQADVLCNGERYTLFLQPSRHNRIYALYALRTFCQRGIAETGYELIEKNPILSLRAPGAPSGPGPPPAAPQPAGIDRTKNYSLPARGIKNARPHSRGGGFPIFLSPAGRAGRWHRPPDAAPGA